VFHGQGPGNLAVFVANLGDSRSVLCRKGALLACPTPDLGLFSLKESAVPPTSIHDHRQFVYCIMEHVHVWAGMPKLAFSAAMGWAVDSVFSFAGNAVRLSEDHKPDRRDEKLRIENNGGYVMQVLETCACARPSYNVVQSCPSAS
jgi:serine/threonine protein phosphatase PrpC